MATRLYLPSTGTPAISPSFLADWEDVTIGARLTAVTTKISSALTTVSFGDGNAANRDVLFRQYIYGPIASQTIGVQTLKWQILAKERDATCNMFTAIGVRVVRPAGTDVGAILALTRDATELSATALTNRQFSATTSSVTSGDGDYIVIEIGTGGDPGGGSDHDSDLRIGDAAASDLSEDDTSTTDDNPWVEFANDVTVYTPKAWLTSTQPVAYVHKNEIVSY